VFLLRRVLDLHALYISALVSPPIGAELPCDGDQTYHITQAIPSNFHLYRRHREAGTVGLWVYCRRYTEGLTTRKDKWLHAC